MILLKKLIVYCFSTAYLLTKNGSLFSIDFNHNGLESNLALKLNCLKSQTVTSIVGQFEWNRAVSPKIFALTWNGMIAIKTALLDLPERQAINIINNNNDMAVATVNNESNFALKTNLSNVSPINSGEVSIEVASDDLKCTDVMVNWTLFGGFFL